MTKTQRRFLIVVLGASASIALAVSAAYACAVLTTLKLDTEVAAAGDTVTGTGQGFRNGDANTVSDVVVTFETRDGEELWRGRAAEDRSVDVSFAVPDAGPGYYVIIATQYFADGSPVAGSPARATLQITAATTSSSSSHASGEAAAGGSSTDDGQTTAVAPSGAEETSATTTTSSQAVATSPSTTSTTPQPAAVASPSHAAQLATLLEIDARAAWPTWTAAPAVATEPTAAPVHAPPATSSAPVSGSIGVNAAWQPPSATAWLAAIIAAAAGLVLARTRRESDGLLASP